MPYWLAGIIAGLIAGAIMAAIAMMLMPTVGRTMLAPVKLMAGLFEGEAAVDGGMGTVLLGAMIHMVMSAVFGLIGGLIAQAAGWTSLGTLIVAGIIWAIILFLVNQYITLRIVDPVMAARMPPPAFLASHIGYGVVLGWLIWVFI